MKLVTRVSTPGPDTTRGRVRGVAQLDDALEHALFNGFLYLNIHSGTFTGGNLVLADDDDDDESDD